MKQGNETLKRKLIKMKTAFRNKENTLGQLSAPNKNKQNVEKAIIKELLNTNNILKKISMYEIPLDLKNSKKKHHTQENKKRNIKFRSRCFSRFISFHLIINY